MVGKSFKRVHFKSYIAYCCCFLFTQILLCNYVMAQKGAAKSATTKAYKSGVKEFAISYAITVEGTSVQDLAQSYNGGLKTNFIKNDVGRIRLVSLMRTHSLFFSTKANAAKQASIIKESGKVRTKMLLSNKQWKVYNNGYDSATCDIFKDDTTRILGYLCAKAVITSTNGTKVNAYFFPSTKNKTLSAMEPLFAKIPGLVMQYSYSVGDNTINFTAKSIRLGVIEAKSLAIPRKDYQLLSFNPKASSGTIGISEEDDNDDETEEEESEMMGVPASATDSLKTAKPPTK
jgi:hypothetical protein